MGLRRVWRCLPAAWRLTRPWRRPSGLVSGVMGGRLQVGRVLCGCDVLCCAGPRGGSLLAWSAREFLQEAVWWRASSDNFTLGTDGVAMRPDVDSDMTSLSRGLFLQSTRRPYWESRSTPMMGRSTSAITKRHVKSRRSSRFRLLEAHP